MQSVCCTLYHYLWFLATDILAIKTATTVTLDGAGAPFESFLMPKLEILQQIL